MSKAMTENEAVERFSQEYLEHTCSVVCEKCRQSAFFQGQHWNESVPEVFACPTCKATVTR